MSFPVARLSEIQAAPDNFRLLERVPISKPGLELPLQLSAPVGDELNMVLLDTETTGLYADFDEIIEIGMVKVSYSPAAKKITAVLEAFSQFEDPGRPIPENITRLTGISDAMVSQHKIDDAVVARFMADDPLVVAHNARFDRPFFEQRFANMANLAWACSAFGIDWQNLGFGSRKLEYLLLNLGWFYEGHRAAIDCLATAWLLHLQPQACADLLDQANSKTVLVRAFGAPFDVKDTLKARGYRWHNGTEGANKHWWRELGATQLEQEQDFLNELYAQGAERAHYDYVDARTRFKSAS